MGLITPEDKPPSGWLGTWTPQEPYASSGDWYVYIILCSDNSLYAGITTDIERRFQQHVEGRGAKYFRGRKPLQVVYLEGSHSRSTASRREAELKAMGRPGKDLLVAQAVSRKETS